MQPTFWHDTWEKGQIGFHQARVHPGLQAHAAAFLGPDPQRVLVPLCGKTWDMDWLAKQGHEVVGVELSERAVQQFHEEQGRTPTVEDDGPYRAYRSEGLTVWVGDVFELTAHVGEGAFDRVWDRASMVALPPDMRRRYVEVVRQVGRGGRLLLSTFRYDPEVMSGPPFSIDHDEVTEAYPSARVLTSDDTVPPGFAQRGHRVFEQRLWMASL